MEAELTLFDFCNDDTTSNNISEKQMKISNYNDLVNNITQIETLELIDYKSRMITKGYFNNGKVFYRVEYKEFYDELFNNIELLLEFLESEKAFLKDLKD